MNRNELNQAVLLQLFSLLRASEPPTVRRLAERTGADRIEVVASLLRLEMEGLADASTLRLTLPGLAAAAALDGRRSAAAAAPATPAQSASTPGGGALAVRDARGTSVVDALRVGLRARGRGAARSRLERSATPTRCAAS